MLWLALNATPTSPLLTLDIFYQYLIHGNGPLASIGLTKLAGFINTVNGIGRPDFEIQFFYLIQNSATAPEFFEKLGYREDIKKKLLYKNTLHDIAGVASVQLHAKSEGYVTL